MKIVMCASITSGLILQSPFGLECQPPGLRHAQIDRPGSAVRATAEPGGPADSGKGDCSTNEEWLSSNLEGYQTEAVLVLETEND